MCLHGIYICDILTQIQLSGLNTKFRLITTYPKPYLIKYNEHLNIYINKIVRNKQTIITPNDDVINMSDVKLLELIGTPSNLLVIDNSMSILVERLNVGYIR